MRRKKDKNTQHDKKFLEKNGGYPDQLQPFGKVAHGTFKVLGGKKG